VADFSATPTSGTAPLTVTFTDLSTGDITSWSWDFDNDGAEDSTEQNPSYDYENPGTYSVKLTVTGPGGSHTGTKPDYIRVVYVGYVDESRPDDTGDGLTWVTAKKLIQSGINTASNGWLVLVANGTYTGTGNKNLDFNGKAIHLMSVGGADNCIIDCENSGRGFYFHSGETSTSIVEGFTIRNGSVGDYGGGVFCQNSSPTFTDCTISGNTANSGGGVFCQNSSPTFTNCAILDNTADHGGGVSCVGSSSPTFTNCVISGNSTGYWGGGVYCLNYFSSVTFRNSIIWGNTADSGEHQIYVDSNCSVTLSYSCYANGTNNVGGGGTVTASDCIVSDPLFVDAANGNYRLQDISPCIDAGFNDYIVGYDTDLDGNPRIQNSTVDIGAYEHQP
jgi:PKD repeat protein